MRADRRRRELLAFLAAAATAPRRVSASASPPLRLVVAYPPGGITDAVARAMAPILAARLGEPVIVDNRGGAGGVLALRALTHAAPDGRMLVLSGLPPAVLALGSEDAPRLASVACVMSTPAMLVGTPAFDGRSFEDMVAQARARPQSLRWATTGNATTGHLILTEVSRVFGLSVTHVPYQGGSQQLIDAIAGHFELLSTNVGQVQMQYAREGKLRPLAVGAPARLALLPAVPTFAELHCPSANLDSLFALFAAPGTSPRRIALLNRAVDATLRSGPLGDLVRASGSLPLGGPPQALDQAIARVRHALAWLPQVEKGAAARLELK